MCKVFVCCNITTTIKELKHRTRLHTSFFEKGCMIWFLPFKNILYWTFSINKQPKDFVFITNARKHTMFEKSKPSQEINWTRSVHLTILTSIICPYSQYCCFGRFFYKQLKTFCGIQAQGSILTLLFFHYKGSETTWTTEMWTVQKWASTLVLYLRG